jgi:hypothetical protein
VAGMPLPVQPAAPRGGGGGSKPNRKRARQRTDALGDADDEAEGSGYHGMRCVDDVAVFVCVCVSMCVDDCALHIGGFMPQLGSTERAAHLLLLYGALQCTMLMPHPPIPHTHTHTNTRARAFHVTARMHLPLRSQLVINQPA